MKEDFKSNLTLIGKRELKEYLKNDWIYSLVNPDPLPEYASDFGCNQWLIESAPKRMILSYMYGDLISKKDYISKRILDVGGGVNLCQKMIAQKYDLSVLDCLTHDKIKSAEHFFKENGISLINVDWFDMVDSKDNYDLIIANDLFPNVDQRLSEFIENLLPKTRCLRILLTYYNSLRFYTVKRLDADEVMYMRAWNGKDILAVLKTIAPKTWYSKLEKINHHHESIFPNGRVCAILEIER